MVANIGESFALKRYITAESKRKDVCSVGTVMMEFNGTRDIHRET
jgi:hypothetical protein